MKDNIYIPNKTIVSGHVGSHYGNILKLHPNIEMDSKEYNDIKKNVEKKMSNNLEYFKTFVSNKIIGLDGRCYKGGFVNIFVIEE